MVSRYRAPFQEETRGTTTGTTTRDGETRKAREGEKNDARDAESSVIVEILMFFPARRDDFSPFAFLSANRLLVFPRWS